MEKQQLISLIKEKVASGEISKSDLQEVFSTNDFHLTNKISNIFYAIGALIAVVGVLVLILENWSDIGSVGRVLVSLGLALITYISAYFTKEKNMLSQAMFAISAVLAPIGSFILLDEMKVVVDSGVILGVAIVLFVIFFTSKLILKKDILTIASVFFGTWSYFSLITKMFDGSMIDTNVMKWSTIFLGVSYIALGIHRMSVAKRKNIISSLFFGFGTLAIMLPFETMGGIFNLFMFVVIFAGFYGSIFLKSRTMLALSALFLMAHLVKLTGEYFADSIGWPVALIFLGFVVIGVGYFTLELNKKYFRK